MNLTWKPNIVTHKLRVPTRVQYAGTNLAAN